MAPGSVNKPFFNSFLKKRVAVCKDAMVKSLNNVHYMKVCPKVVVTVATLCQQVWTLTVLYMNLE